MSLPIFETPHLLGRHLLPDDLDVMLAVYGDAETMQWVGDGQPLSREQCLNWIEITHKNYTHYGYGMFALVLRQTGEVIGFCGLIHPGGQPEVEIKYALLREFRGRGLATEAVRALIVYGVEAFSLTQVTATAYTENAASHRVLVKSGMKAVGSQDYGDGKPICSFVWQNGVNP